MDAGDSGAEEQQQAPVDGANAEDQQQQQQEDQQQQQDEHEEEAAEEAADAHEAQDAPDAPDAPPAVPADAAPHAPPVVTDLTADTSSDDEEDESDSDDGGGYHSSKKRKVGGGGYGGEESDEYGEAVFVFVLTKVDLPEQGTLLPTTSVLGTYSSAESAEDAKADFLGEGAWEKGRQGSYVQGDVESAIEIHQTILED